MRAIQSGFHIDEEISRGASLSGTPTSKPIRTVVKYPDPKVQLSNSNKNPTTTNHTTIGAADDGEAQPNPSTMIKFSKFSFKIHKGGIEGIGCGGCYNCYGLDWAGGFWAGGPGGPDGPFRFLSYTPTTLLKLLCLVSTSSLARASRSWAVCL